MKRNEILQDQLLFSSFDNFSFFPQFLYCDSNIPEWKKQENHSADLYGS